MTLFDDVKRILRFPRKASGKGQQRNVMHAPFHPHTDHLRCLHMLVILMLAASPLALAAQPAPNMTDDRELPNAPDFVESPATSVASETTGKGSATILGTVMDANGSEVQNADVMLKSSTGAPSRSEESGSNGEFTFTGLPAGDFKLTVSGKGWGTYVSPEIQLHAGEFHILPNVVLPLSTSAVVRVVGSPAALSEEQVQIAEQQRVLGVIPNFYSSYDWNAPPMLPKQKFQLALRSLIDPVTFAGVAVSSGIEQEANVYSGFGTGFQGYAKRYGAGYATDFTGRILANAAFPSLFHQDPRYFYRGSGSFTSRALYAISRAVITRGDNGREEPNYSYVLGTFTAGAISNLYYPPGDRGALLTFANGLVDIADDAGGNLLREFILKPFTSRVRRVGAP